MSEQDITLTAADGGSFGAYLAAPASGSGSGVVVLQEIFGVNEVMRGIADGLAAQGQFAIVPDLFWRQEPGIQITDRSEAEWQRAFELYQGFDENLGVDDASSPWRICAPCRGAAARPAASASASAASSPT